MDLVWMGQKLTEYYELIGFGTDHYTDRAKVLRLEPTVGEILRRLDPALADCDINAFDNWGETVDAVDGGLGILAAREACETKLGPDVPALSDRTIGLMIEAAGHYASSLEELAAMLRRCDLARYADVSTATDKTEMLASALLGARDRAEKTGSRQAQRSLLDFICLVAERAYRNQVLAPRWRDELEKDHKYESANGDLRTALEDLVTRLAEDRADYARQPRANQGNAAIRHLIQTKHLPEDDGGMLVLGLWKLSHTNGPHPGQSDADEARFRMQVITATARFLLKHLGAA